MGSGINNKIDEFLCNPKDVKKRRNKKPAAQRTLLHSKALSPEESAGNSEFLNSDKILVLPFKIQEKSHLKQK